MIDVKIDLNKSLNSFSNRIKVRQGDVGEKMRITLTDNKFSLENQNNLQVKFEGNIRSGDYVEGIAFPYNDKAGEFVYQFKSEDVSIPGAYQRAFIRVYDESGNRISSEDIFVEVLKDADISNNQSKIYVSKLDELLEDFDDDFGKFLTGKEEDYSALDEKSKELNSELSDLKKGSNEIKNTQTEIIQSIEDNDLATKNDLETAKQASSANVINQIGGAESAILKKELLVDGTEGMASRFVKDLGPENLIRDKNDFDSKFWRKNANPTVVKNGFSQGIDSIRQNYPSDSTELYKEIVNQVLNYKSDRVERLVQGEWYTVTFYAKSIGETGSMNSFVYPKGVDVNTKMYVNGIERTVDTNADGGLHWALNKNFQKYSFSFKTINGISADDFKAQLMFRIGTKGVAVEVANIDVCKGKNIDKEPTVAPEDVGVVHGQPNLLDGTSNEWVKSTNQFVVTGYTLAELGLKIGDSIALRTEFRNLVSSSNQFAHTHLICINSSGTSVREAAGNAIRVGESGVSTATLTIPEGTDHISVRRVRINGFVTGDSVEYRESKLIKGSAEAMDEWTPSQSDSGLTIVNNGMVPFTDDEYATLLSEDGVVRSETLMVGQAAGIDFDFPVIARLEEKYPYLFEDCENYAEKIKKYLSIYKSVTLTARMRGFGVPLTGTNPNYSRGYTITKNGGIWGFGNIINTSDQMRSSSQELNEATAQQVHSDGTYKFSISTRKNLSESVGSVSDGVISSWVEVKDIRLTIELEVNGRTIIEELIAANRVENLATQEEAVMGEDNTKTMTPLRVNEALENKAVSIAGNQTVGGIKNFRDGLLLNDIPLSSITRKVVYEADGIGGYFNQSDKFILGVSEKIDRVVLLWSRVDDVGGTLLNYSWSQTVLSPDDIILGYSYRIQLTNENYKFVTFANEMGKITISGANENSVAPNRIYRIKRIISYIKD